jgi:tryptophan synthase alpha chain
VSAATATTETTRVDAPANRTSAAFAACKAQGRAALIPFVTGGYPTMPMTEKLLWALAEGGADLIEIGVPFSDPLADGATVQHTSQVALDQGTTLTDCLGLVRRVRADGFTVPLLFMGYSNPFYQYGLERLARDAAEAGLDGFIIADLPIDESDEFIEPFCAAGLDLIFMLAPTSTEVRIEAAAARASGFIYCVSLVGVTGARDSLSDELPAYLARVRKHTDVPLAVGFGISTPDHVRATAALADGVVVASALINHLDRLPHEEQPAAATTFVRAMAAATGKSGRTAAASTGGEG